MKNIKRIITLILCMVLLFTSSITIADTVLDDDALNYRFSELLGMLAITGYSGKETKLAFPSELNGKKVVQIGSGKNDRSFYYNGFVEVVIPEGVEAIADYTFADCKTLRIIEIPGSVRQIPPPESLFAGIDDYEYIFIRTLRGSKADEYAQKYNMHVEYTGTMETPTPIPTMPPTPTPAQTPTLTPVRQVSVNVPVYYLDQNNNEIVAQDTLKLNHAGKVSVDKSLIPAGYMLSGSSEVYVDIQGDNALPNTVLFRLKKPPPTATPTSKPTKTPTPGPTNTPSPTPDPLSMMSQSERDEYIKTKLEEYGLMRPTTKEEIQIVLKIVPELEGYLYLSTPAPKSTKTPTPVPTKKPTPAITKAPTGSFTSGDFVFTGNSDGTATITEYKGSQKNLNIPEQLNGYQVTRIGQSAFILAEMTSMTIPKTVTAIEAQAFYSCSELSNVTIPEGVKVIGDGAFFNCCKLTNITIPDSVSNIGTNPFLWCDNLKEINISKDHPHFAVLDGALVSKNEMRLVTYPCGRAIKKYVIPTGIKIIGKQAFELCERLTGITIPNTVTDIHASAFRYCRGLTEITLPEGLETLRDNAFDWCEKLNKVTISGSVKTIGTNPFSCCTRLKEIIVSKNNSTFTVIHHALVRKNDMCLIAYPCGYSVNQYTVPEDIKTIGAMAFSNSKSLNKVILPDSVKYIKEHAFYSCTNLAAVTLSNSVRTIEDYTFMDCKNLSKITIPDSVTSIGSWVFPGCKNLSSLIIPASVTSIGDKMFDDDDCPKLTISVVQGSYAENYCKDHGLRHKTIPKPTNTPTPKPTNTPAKTPAGKSAGGNFVFVNNEDTPAGKGNVKQSITEKHIGISFPTNDLQRWHEDGNNLKASLEAAGFSVELEYAGNDVLKQINQINDMLANKCELLIVTAIDSGSLSQSLKKAKRLGIPVIAYDRLIMDSDAVSYYITLNNYKVGTEQGSYIKEALDLDNTEGPFYLEITAGDPQDKNARYFYQGAIDILRPYIDAGKLIVKSGQIDFNSVATTYWRSETAQNRAAGIIASFYSDGSSIDAWLCSNDSTAMGVINALEDNYDGQWPVITGQDCDLANVEQMLAGKQSMSVFKDTRVLVAQTAKMAGQILTGGKADVNDTYHNGSINVPAFLCDPVVVDLTNYERILLEDSHWIIQ